ncbi:MAG: MTAP family purine nucleoside phosphorylase [Deltaproteobacteria bacterium]|nr:MTAP family purine nucleoside phosphorylase [Deltaproteobacteria bacterium]
MQPLGIISGTVFLQGQAHFKELHEETVKTIFGEALVLRSPEVVFIPRHGQDPQRHILPHLINHGANLQAMKDLGVREIIGIHSTGSLKRRLKPGMLVVPDDYLMPTPGPTVVGDRPLHIVPVLDEPVRQKWLAAAREAAGKVIDGGIYWQTTGPRLETRAEIAMMSRFADLVGMTMASEAIVAQELGLPFASLCSVDNFAHGLVEKELSMEKILATVRRNTETIARILTCYLERNLR